MTIYIREAHPVDGWWLGGGIPGMVLKASKSRARFDLKDPQTIEERRKAAGECETALKYGIHTYIDEMDDAVNKAYAAWPTRLYLVGLDGRVVYQGGLGPFGFKPARFGRAIKQYLAWVRDGQPA